MQKSSMAQSAAITILSALFLVPSGVLAQSATAPLPVAFRVEVGDLSCKDDIGAASVLFVTDPKEGGYFDIIGATIDQNKITLDRRVALQSGKYTWKGIASDGYRETPPSLGEFTIPECGVSSETITPVSSAKKQPIPAAVKKETEPENATEISITASSSDVLSSEENGDDKADQSQFFKWIMYGIVVLGLTIGAFAWKKPMK